MKYYFLVVFAFVCSIAKTDPSCIPVPITITDNFYIQDNQLAVWGSFDVAGGFDPVSNSYHLTIDWNSYSGPLSGYSLNDKKGLLSLKFLEAFYRDEISNKDPMITYTINFYEKKDCYYNKTCYLRIDRTSTTDCIDPEFGESPAFIETPTSRLMRLFTGTGFCGSVCCVTPVSFKPSNYYDFTDLNIHPSFQISSNCTEPIELDCLTQQPYNCVTPDCDYIQGGS